MRINIQTKLFILMVGLTAVVLGAVLYTVSEILTEAIQQKIVYDFNQTEKTFRQIQRFRYERLVESSGVIGENPAFKGNVQLGDPASMEYFVKEELAQYSDLGLFIVTDRKGDVLTGYNAPSGIEVKGRSGVQRALRGDYGYLIGVEEEQWPELMAVGDMLYLVSTVPVFLADDVIGSLAQGVYLGEREAKDIKGESATEITIVLDGQLMASTVKGLTQEALASFCGSHQDSLDAMINQMRASQPFTGVLDGQEVFAFVSPLGEGENAFYIASVLTANELGILGVLENNIIKAGGVTLGITLFLAFFLGRRLSQPILRLVEGMNRVKSGDLDISLKATTHDEIGLLTSTFNEMIGGLRERLQLMRYVGSHTQKMIRLSSGTAVNLGGTRQELAVMFTDIRGFTAFSEKRQPEEVISMLNRYLGFQAEIVPQYEGSIDKFVGDEMVALFIGERALERAIECALAIERRMQEEHAKDPQPVFIGTGINYGSMILGNMGAENRLDYTVIGAEVNLGARLCDAAAPGEILIRKELLDGLQTSVRVAEIKMMAFKGFSEDLEIASLTDAEVS